MKKHCTALFLLASMLLTTLACERKQSFSVTVDGSPYRTKMKEAKAYTKHIHYVGFEDSGRFVLNFPTPRKGDVMGGYGTGLMITLNPQNIEAGDEFFLGIYEQEGKAIIAQSNSESTSNYSSLDPDAPLDWRADSGEDEEQHGKLESQFGMRSVEASLETRVLGSNVINSFTTRKPGGGIHIEFEEFEARVGGRIKGRIIEATLIGHKMNAESYERLGSEISIMKVRNFPFDTTFGQIEANFGG